MSMEELAIIVIGPLLLVLVGVVLYRVVRRAAEDGTRQALQSQDPPAERP